MPSDRGEHRIHQCRQSPRVGIQRRDTRWRSPKRSRPKATRWSPAGGELLSADMSKHYAYGTDKRLKQANQEYAAKL
jgi:hypothetical protein